MVASRRCSVEGLRGKWQRGKSGADVVGKREAGRSCEARSQIVLEEQGISVHATR